MFSASTSYRSFDIVHVLNICRTTGCRFNGERYTTRHHDIKTIMQAAKQLSELPKEVMWRVLGFVDESHRGHCAAVDRRWSSVGKRRGNSSMGRGLRSRGSIPNELLVGLVLQFLDEPDNADNG